ncbi:MAG TPA: hypothetical protein VM600_03220 [Actinomycetota bacterium]|nr:hypothetical protein [Actinomycetota bacterium]
MISTAFNTTDAPVVIDERGRTIGGGEWGAVDTDCAAATAALADGRLRLVGDIPSESAPAALAAAARTNELAARAKRLEGLDESALRRIAERAGVQPGLERIWELAVLGVEPPAKATATTSTKKED